jgi:hypothetical protein
LVSIVWEFQPFGSYEYTTCKYSVVDLLS